jgi:hypothetical protein
MYSHRLVTTGCCKESIEHKVVRLYFDVNYETFTSYDDLKPTWTARGFKNWTGNSSENYYSEAYVDVKFCPFCGTKVPDIELNNSVNKKEVHNGDLDYCETCGERNMCCECLPPEFKWKPVGYYVEIPIIVTHDDEN